MAPEPLPPAKEFVVFDSDLNDEWFERYRGTSALAVDTEAMGLVHGRDRLCLVQICDDQDRVCCVRIGRGQSAAPKLQQLMEAETIEKVFHFARFDVAALAAGLAIKVNPIFAPRWLADWAAPTAPAMALKMWCRSLWGWS